MSITNTQTKFFTSGEIKFSAIRDTFGDLAGTDVRASDYLRNAGTNVDWEASGQTKTISPRVPNATENADVSTADDWQVSHLRDSIVEYNVVQDASTSDEELEFADTNVPTWNNNLSKNVNKKMSVEGTIYADEVSKYALTFSTGEYNNLTIDVPNGGKIYGEGGSAGGGNGGGALYVKNTASYDDVSITIGSNGQIWAGGGGGRNGNSGNSGSQINCYANQLYGAAYFVDNDRWYNGSTAGNACQTTNYRPSGAYSINVQSASPTSLRNRCRGGNVRAGQGWNPNNFSGYQCSPGWTLICQARVPTNVSGGNGGSGGSGGVGQGFSNQSGPGSGNSGNSGNTGRCNTTGATSTGNSGNSGASGGTWGVSGGSGGGSAGFALLRRGATINSGQSSNNLKGPVGNT